MVARNAGRFAKAEDFVPELPMESYLNTRHVEITTGAAGAGNAVEVETGLTVENMGDQAKLGLKWVLYGAVWQPADLAAYAQMTGAVLRHLMLQIQRGQRAIGDLAARGNNDVIAQSGVILQVESGLQAPVPFDIPSPVPVLSRFLTVLVGHNDAASVNALDLVVSLFFGFAAINQTDRTALMQLSL